MEELKATEAETVVTETAEAETIVSETVEVETEEVETEDSEITETETVATETVEVETEDGEITETETMVAETVEIETEDGETTETETVVMETVEVETAEGEASDADVVAEAPTSIDEITPKMKLEGTVARLELYGAFIDIGIGTNALIHISKLGKDHVNRVSDVLQVGDVVSVWVDKVNPEQGQIMVTMVEPLAVEWSDLKKGQTYSGTITRLENYGAFIDIGAEREGLVHISEISHDYVKHPSDLLTVGDVVEVEVLDFSRRKRRIDLSIKNLLEKPQAEASAAAYKTSSRDEVDDFEEELEDVPTAMEVALRRAMGDEPIDAIEGQSKRGRKKDRRRRRRRDQDDLLDRTLQFQHD